MVALLLHARRFRRPSYPKFFFLGHCIVYFFWLREGEALNCSKITENLLGRKFLHRWIFGADPECTSPLTHVHWTLKPASPHSTHLGLQL
jgi:hypothetical protein